ncbi:MAG: RING-HC finger protein [Janthinobacterium lividum]
MLCFCCGNSLDDLEDSDDPWIEHARFFPDCTYLRLSRGNYFVDTVVKGLNTLETFKRFGNSDYFFDPCFEIIESDDLTSTDGVKCKICYKERLEVLFIPCGHVSACVQCASTMKKCPICRYPISVMLRFGVYSQVEKNKPLTENTTCMVCHERPVEAMNIPCRHASVCVQCSDGEHRCNMCYTPAYCYLKIYI